MATRAAARRKSANGETADAASSVRAHAGEIAEKTRSGRLEFLAQFPSLAAAEIRAAIPDPSAPSTFAQCRLDARDDIDNAYRALHVDLIRMRKSDPAFAAQRADCIEGAVIGPRAFALRFRVPHAPERLLVLNLGIDIACVDCASPLLAPPRDGRWVTLWSSESVRYGGNGLPRDTDVGLMIFPGRSAVVFGADDTGP